MLAMMRSLRGYLRLALTGPQVAEFIQAAAERGVEFWNVRVSAGQYTASVSASELGLLRRPARRTHTRVRVVGRRGLRFLLRGAATEALATGLALFVTLVYLLGAFVWRIEIKGLVALPRQAVLEALDLSGLRAGQPRRLVKPEQVEDGLLRLMPIVSWVSVELDGVVARVEIVEKVTRERILQGMLPADVVAGKDGTIQTLIVLQGQPRAREGDRVRAGDVLIAGEPSVWDFFGRTVPPAGWPPAAVRARGIVKAEVTYDLYAEAPLRRVVSRRTGRHWTRTVLRVGVRDIILTGGRVPAYAGSEEETYSLAWRGGRGEVVLELISTTHHELERRTEVLGRDGARLEAEALVRQELGRCLCPGSKIVSQEAQEVPKPDAVGVRLVVQAIEDIAETRARVAPPP